MKGNWFRRRWMELRWGHTMYLAFLLSGINFLLISYRLFIEHIPALATIFTNLYLYAVIFTLTYFPLAIYIGHWHRARQLRTELTLTVEQNPYFMDWDRRLKRIEEMLRKETEV